MAGLITTVGDNEFIKRALNGTTPTNVLLRLFTNNHTPVKADTNSNYTECAVSGYAAITLTGTSWDYTTTPGTAAFAQQTFTISTTATIYGYFITDSGGTNVYAAEIFSDGPYSIPSGGGSVQVTPSVTFN